MYITVENFFRPIKLQQHNSELDYKKVEPLVSFAKSLSQLTYQSVYLIDYYVRGFAYVSENPLFLCGKTSQQVLKAGYSFYLHHVPADDLKLLLKINEAGFTFFNTIPPENRCDYSISYDFHICQDKRDAILINHKLTPVLLDRDSNIWIALCIVSMSPNSEAGNIFIRQKRALSIFEYDLKSQNWIMKKVPKLNPRERAIILLSRQGLTMGDIARKLFLSIDTIKFHKKNIFKKLQVRSISVAIGSAETLNII